MMTNKHAVGQVARGFTLIEMLVAMVLGIIVTGGIISLFVSTSKANRVQANLAHIQENGRFAVARLSRDLRMTNAQYCSATGGKSNKVSTGYVFQPQLRSPQIMAKTLVLSDGTTPGSGASATGAYSMPADLFLRGYECGTSSCSPTVPATLPAMGTSVGDRVVSADVLTIRYIAGDGWALGPGKSSQVCAGSNTLTSVTISPSSSEQPASYFASGDLAMLADCSQSQVFAVTGTGTLAPDTGKNFTSANPVCVQPENGGRLFDFSKDLTTVTYYLQLQADDNPDAPVNHKVATLMRKVNSQPATAVVRGVERFDLRYEVEDNQGRTAALTADQVDTGDVGTGGSLTCPPAAPNAPPGITDSCLWRAVKAIDVSLLMNSVDDMPSLPDGELAFAYPPDGASVQTPPATMTNGLDRKMMRRSFNFVVTVRNYNP